MWRQARLGNDVRGVIESVWGSKGAAKSRVTNARVYSFGLHLFDRKIDLFSLQGCVSKKCGELWIAQHTDRIMSGWPAATG